MGCTDVSKETHIPSDPKGGSGEKFNRSWLLLVDTSCFPKSKAQLWCHKSPSQLQQPRYTEVLEISHLVQKANGYTLAK